MAVYWADGPGSETPPGHWNLIAQWLSRRHRQTLDQDAKMFLALNRLLDRGALPVRVHGVWPLERVADAHRAVAAGVRGRIVLRVADPPR